MKDTKDLRETIQKMNSSLQQINKYRMILINDIPTPYKDRLIMTLITAESALGKAIADLEEKLIHDQ